MKRMCRMAFMDIMIEMGRTFPLQVLLLCCIHNAICVDADCGTVRYNGYLTNSTYQIIKLNLPKTDQLKITYNISFRERRSFPVVAFKTNRTIQFNSHLDPTHKCYKKGLMNIIHASQYYIYLCRWFGNSGCKLSGDWNICLGTRQFYTATESEEWWLEVGYKCGTEQPMDIHIHMEFQCTFPMPCEKLAFAYCRDNVKYNETIFPNTLGMMSQRAANDILIVALMVFKKHTECYKYTQSFMCYSLFPKCLHGRMVIPCMQTCIEATTGCRAILEHFSQPLYCGSYPASLDPNLCYYQPITCPEPAPPSYGHVVSEGRNLFNVTQYSCDDGFKLEGDSHMHCTYSGKWNSSEPTCVPVNRFGAHVMIGAIGGAIACVVLVAAAFCVHFRGEIQLLSRHSRITAGNFCKVIMEKRPLFLTYCSQERDKVEKQFLPVMRAELPMCNILTYQEFPGGGSLLDNISKGVWESQAVVVLLTRNYINSPWCRFEFTECQTRHALDSQFRLIIVLFEEITSKNDLLDFIEELPPGMKNWVQTREYLTYGESLFWNKLRCGLKM